MLWLSDSEKHTVYLISLKRHAESPVGICWRDLNKNRKLAIFARNALKNCLSSVKDFFS